MLSNISFNPLSLPNSPSCENARERERVLHTHAQPSVRLCVADSSAFPTALGHHQFPSLPTFILFSFLSLANFKPKLEFEISKLKF